MRTLVVFYSRSGNTRRVAHRIAAALAAEVEEIEDLDDRSGILGYLRSGHEASARRPARIAPITRDLAAFDLVVIGTPVWRASVSSPVRTFLEAHAGHVSRHARTNGDGVHGFEPAGELVPFGDVARDDGGDGDLRVGRGRLLRRRARAAGGKRGDQDDDEDGETG